MAAAAHCLYCFEVLHAHLEKRQPLSLSKIEHLYEKLLNEDLRDTNGVTTNGVVTNRVTTNGVTTNGAATSEVKTNGKLSNGHANGLSNGYSSRLTAAISYPPPRPLFVTWNTYKYGSKQLRGCIGTFENQPLEAGLKAYALTAALDDTRFSPISRKELHHLDCGVTLLTDFEPCKNSMDWTLGIHGLRISFVYHGRKMGATYLPDVPAEQGWTQEETLTSLMRKAGWSGRKEEWRKVELTVIRYQGRKASVDYDTYKRLMELYEEGEEVEDEEDDDENVEVEEME